MQSPTRVLGGDNDDLFAQFFSRSPEPSRSSNNFGSTERYMDVPLVSSLLKDLECKGYKCQACKRLNLDQSLRFFSINEHTEVFKCENQSCMFPFRNFIFRNGESQTFFTRKAVKTSPNLPVTNSPPYDVLPGSSSRPDDQRNIEAILDELFPDERMNSIPVQANPPHATFHSSEAAFASPTPPLQLPPRTLTKAMDLVKRRGLIATSPAQPKNIKSPLDLVKNLLQRKSVEPVGVVTESLQEASNKMKKLDPVMQSPSRHAPQSPTKRKTVSKPSSRVRTQSKSKPPPPLTSTVRTRRQRSESVSSTDV